MKNKKIICAALFTMALCAGGCKFPFGSNTAEIVERPYIELAEPVKFENSPEKVLERNIYNGSLCACTVIPYTEEYAFNENVRSCTYYVLPGEYVSEGDMLAAPETGDNGEIERLSKELSDAAKEIEDLKTELAVKPDAGLQKQLDMKQELYELDYAYKSGIIENLTAKRDSNIIKSRLSGIVSSIFDSDGAVKAGAGVIAVSDMTQKLIYTDFFRTSELNGAEDYYVLADGKRYECSKVECSEKNKSLFKIQDPDNTLKIGDTCVFVFISDHVDNALSISTELIKNDTSGSYVYVLTESNPEKRYLTLGISDGYFTEVKSGLSLGEMIADSESEKDSGKYGVVTKTDTVTNIKERGYFFWPRSESIKCSIKHGKAYIIDYMVSLYDSIDVGDPICSIYVVGDDIELERLQTNLKRLIERNASEEKINALTEQVEDLLKDYKAATITADKAGIVVGITEHKSGDVINYGDELIQVTDAKNCYVIVQNSANLSFGNEVKITYTNTDRKPAEADGKVINIGNLAVATTLKADYRLISLNSEDAGKIMKAQRSGMGRAGIYAEMSAHQYTDVLAVPKSAVTVYSGNHSVKIVCEDGSIKKQCFLCLGSDKDFYYCLDGLREGETVCLK